MFPIQLRMSGGPEREEEAARILDQFERETGRSSTQSDETSRSYVIRAEDAERWVSDELDRIAPAWRECLRFVPR
jgi:hypothetical protein